MPTKWILLDRSGNRRFSVVAKSMEQAIKKAELRLGRAIPESWHLRPAKNPKPAAWSCNAEAIPIIKTLAEACGYKVEVVLK